MFIVGADRSGTTLVRLLLNAHSQVAVPAETWFLVDLMREFEADDRLGPDEIWRAIDLVTSRRRFHNFGITRGRLVEAVLADPAVSVASFFERFMELAIESSGKPRWIDKTPEYVLHLDRLRSVFPDARVINVTRDGRDVFTSLQPLRWRGRTPWRIGRYWSACIAAAVEAGARMPAEQWLWIRYEDLVLDLDATLRRICAFVEVGFEPGMLDFHSSASENLTGRALEKGFHDKLARPVSPDDAHRWRQGRRTVESWMFEAVAAKALSSAGYPTRLHPWVKSLGYWLSLAHHVVYSWFAKLAGTRGAATT